MCDGCISLFLDLRVYYDVPSPIHHLAGASPVIYLARVYLNLLNMTTPGNGPRGS